MTAVTVAGTPAGLVFRDMEGEDRPGGLRLSEAAGWNQRAEDWEALLANGRFRVAVRDGRVVGTGGAVVYGRRLAWVAMILVDPAERGQGVGTRLVEEAVAGVSGVDVVGLDATPLGAPVYARLGFTERGAFRRMERPPDAGSLPLDGSACRRLGGSDLARLTERDRGVFGADRSAVLRWAFDQAPEYAWATEAPAGRGYVFGRHGRRSEHVGPLVADDVATAATLLRAVLVAGRGRAFTLDVPDRPEWLDALDALGFRAQRPFRRMILGGAPNPGDPAPLFALFGPEFG